MKKFVFMITAFVLFAFTISSCNKPEKTVPVDGVKLDKSSMLLMLGESDKLEATIAPDDADNKNLKWESSNLLVATVDQNGLVSAVAFGEAVVKVTTEDGEHYATCAVVVEKYFTMVTNAKVVTFAMTGSGSAVIDWGDGGNKQSVTLQGTVTEDDAVSKTYSNEVSRTITVYGPAIARLYCTDNLITDLNLSRLGTTFYFLNCANNRLKSLDISKNTLLNTLTCYNNELASLDVSKNTALASFNCRSNKLSNLNVSGLNSLREFLCHTNNFDAEALDVLFESLHNNVVQEKSIDVRFNPGTDTCNPSIAENKGWKVIK